MGLLYRIWNNFKSQPDIWFFYGFLASFTLSIRKVLFFYPINGQFNEYSGIYLYLSDIFLLLTLFGWAISILQNKSSYLSIITARNVPRGTILSAFILISWSFISIIWSDNQNIAFFKSLKLLELYLLFIYMIFKIVPRGTILQNSFITIIFVGIIQSIVGIWQFIFQHSIGLFWLKESLISPEIPGVAKLIFNGEKIIRSYGLLPHPNILGGFLLLSIIFTLVYRKMFHVEQFKQKAVLKCSTWNNSHCEVYDPIKNVPRGTFYNHWKTFLISDYFYNIAMIIQIIGLILTFSKSAIIGLATTIIYIHYGHNILSPIHKLFRACLSIGKVEQFKQKEVLKCSTWNNSHCEVYDPIKNVPRGTINVKRWLLVASIIIILMCLLHPNIDSLLFKSLDERLLYTNVSRGTILDNPIIGSGTGQFVINMQKYANQTLFDWQFQPVHNVFLLIWSELGLIGLCLFIFFLYKLFHVEQFKQKEALECSTWNNSQCESYKIAKNVPRPPAGRQGGTFPDQKEFKIAIQGVLIGFIFIMLFDHYLWDIQQGQIIFWLILGLSVSSITENIDK